MLNRSTLLIRLFFMAAVALGQPERLQIHSRDTVGLRPNAYTHSVNIWQRTLVKM